MAMPVVHPMITRWQRSSRGMTTATQLNIQPQWAAACCMQLTQQGSWWAAICGNNGFKAVVRFAGLLPLAQVNCTTVQGSSTLLPQMPLLLLLLVAQTIISAAINHSVITGNCVVTCTCSE